MYNPILDKDSYKLSHAILYPGGIEGMSAYIEARKPDELITFFGLQIWLNKQRQIQYLDIQEAVKFAAAHGEPFNPKPWHKIINRYDGWMPIKIWAIPEGTKVPSQIPLVRVECEDEDLFWLAMDIETSLQRAVWYPSTIATRDYKNRRTLQRYALETSDKPSCVDFMLHDFGARGVSSEESAAIAGAAHLVYFNGSDTMSGIRLANNIYKSNMSGFSVPATEHSVQCAWGPMAQDKYLETVLDTYATRGAIVSIVIDAYDTFREAERLCTGSLRDKIVASDARIVFRPDSGDPLKIIPRMLRLQEVAFGSKVNSKGYKVINHVGIIQGDGIDHGRMVEIMDAITTAGYAADNIVFGSGGALLQKVDRDTYGFAQKASAIKQYGQWVGIRKDTPGKVSKAGRLTALRSRTTGEWMTGDIRGDDPFNIFEWEDMMPLVWDTGVLKKEQTFDEVRTKARS